MQTLTEAGTPAVGYIPQGVVFVLRWKLRDWSLITGSGGYKTGGRFYPYENGGGKRFSHAGRGRGHKRFLGSFYAVA